MASLDTNCLLRWLLDDIPEQRRRVDALLASGEPLMVDDAALIEAVFALEKGAKLSRSTIHALLLAAMAHPWQIDRDLWTPLLETWTSHPKLSVVDLYLAFKARAAAAGPLYTFDAKLANQVPDVVRVP